MATITEDYVSFETAKLLKEKGFDTFKSYGWDEQLFDKEHPRNFSICFDNKEHWISCPTLQMAMKWLREVHKIYCDIRVGDGDFVIDIMSLKDGEFGCEVVEPECCVYLTYEEACEAAIKYCLENLI